MSKFLSGVLIALAIAAASAIWVLYGECRQMVNDLEAYRAEIVTLKARVAELESINNAQAMALARIQTEALSLSEKLAKAQTQAVKGRAASEIRVQEILTVPAPDDTHELIAWALLESQKLDLGSVK